MKSLHIMVTFDPLLCSKKSYFCTFLGWMFHVSMMTWNLSVMTHLLPAQFSAWVFSQPERIIWNLSKQKHLALSLSSSHPRPLRSAALSSKMKTYKRLKTKIVKFQDPKRSFELFEFLIYSIPYLTKKSFFFAEYTVRAALVTDLLSNRPSVVCLSVDRPSRFKSIWKPFHVESSIVFNL